MFRLFSSISVTDTLIWHTWAGLEFITVLGLMYLWSVFIWEAKNYDYRTNSMFLFGFCIMQSYVYSPKIEGP